MAGRRLLCAAASGLAFGTLSGHLRAGGNGFDSLSSEQTRYEGVQVINTSALEYEQDCLSLKEGVSDEELAYILFTSGSTGKPKGVMIMRKNVAAFMDSFWRTGIEITEEDRC